MKRTIIFDFETNGFLDDPKFQPIEFACLIIDEVEGLERRREQQILIKTKEPISEEITKITGITNEMLDKDGIDYHTFLQGLNQIIFHPYTNLIIGHNIINFDIPIVEKCLNKVVARHLIYDTAAVFKAKLLDFEFGNPYSNFYFDQKKVLETKRKGLKFNLKLATEYYEIPEIQGDFHRALIDCKYTYEVYKKQIQNYINKDQLLT